MSVQILWRPLLLHKIRFYFSALVSGFSLIIEQKNISIFDVNPFRILEIPNVPIFKMMNILRMIRDGIG